MNEDIIRAVAARVPGVVQYLTGRAWWIATTSESDIKTVDYYRYNLERLIRNLYANRIGGEMFGKETKIYKFEKIKRAKRPALAAHPGVELIDFGVGEPDEMALPGVVQSLQREAEKLENRGYADNGIPEFKSAAARYLAKVYGVSNINPETDVLHGIGSKPVLAMMPAAFINPGDVTLLIVPGYPVTGTHTRWYGGEVVNPLTTTRHRMVADHLQGAAARWIEERVPVGQLPDTADTRTS